MQLILLLSSTISGSHLLGGHGHSVIILTWILAIASLEIIVISENLISNIQSDLVDKCLNLSLEKN
jgi:hypothetical protein